MQKRGASFDRESTDLIARIAWLYYRKHLTQQEIADYTGLTRQKVQRFLKRAEELGIVRFEIKHTYSNILSLEEEVKDKFNLKDVIIVPEVSQSGEELKKDLGYAGAQYLRQVLPAVHSIGVGLGSTLRYLAQYFSPDTFREDIKIYSLVGNLLYTIALNPYSIGEKLADKLHAQFYNIWAPAIVQNKNRLKTITSEPWIRQVIDDAMKAELFLCGVGTNYGDLTLMRMGYITKEECQRILRKGAVGDFLGRFLNEEGEIIEDEVHSRVVGVNLDQIKHKEVMIVAGGVLKLKIIKAVIKAGLAKILVTDEEVGKALLAQKT